MKFPLLLLLAMGTLASQAQNNPQVYKYDPGISADGQTIAFVSGGDIWTVPAAGGKARLLVTNQAFESRPLFSPDGKMLAFVSTRTGNGDIYILNLITNQLKQLSFGDLPEELSGWSADSKNVFFSSTEGDISNMRDLFSLPVEGGTPQRLSSDRFVGEFQPSMSPDGSKLLMAAKGYAAVQWWRNGHSHLDESELWMKDMSSGKYTRLQPEGARQTWPMWAADGQRFFYISDRDGHDNIYEQDLKGSVKQVTKFSKGRVLWPSLSQSGVLVFERDFGIWQLDTKSGRSSAMNIELQGIATGNRTEHLELKTISDYAVAGDQKKVAFISRGHVYASSLAEPQTASRITTGTALETNPLWLNNNELVFLRMNKGKGVLYKHDFRTAQTTVLKEEDGSIQSPALSHGGKQLGYVHKSNELRVLDLATGKSKLITQGPISRPIFSNGFTWSPDDKMIAYVKYGTKALMNIWVADLTNGSNHQASFLGNSFGSAPQWRGDGRALYFITAQRTEGSQLVEVRLTRESPVYKEDRFTQLFDPITPQPVKEQVNTSMDSAASLPIVWENIEDRWQALELPGEVDDFTVNSKGDEMIFRISTAGQSAIYQYSLDRNSDDFKKPKLLVSAASPQQQVSYSKDGKTLFYSDRGVLQQVAVATKTPRPVLLSAETDADVAAERMETFNIIWNYQNEGFYDPAFHGANWKEIHNIYEPYVGGSNSADEFRRLMNMMVGELNASHSGVSSAAPLVLREGKAGFATGKFVPGKGLEITEVYNDGPADIAGVKAGDFLISINGRDLNAQSSLPELMLNQAGRKIPLTYRSGTAVKNVSIKPIAPLDEKQLIYKQWVSKNRADVAAMSKGLLGYVHIPDMSEESLKAFYSQVNAQNLNSDGVVVDIRNNNGGFVNGYILDVLSRKAYLSMTVRGLPTAPARTSLGQRALGVPTVLLTNQASLSDAEDFSEGYRTLGLGKIVGEPTAGWIIYTSNLVLYDGTSMRLPYIRIDDHEGKNMELKPRPVDIEVVNDLGGVKDNQLQTAVNTLLTQLGK